MEAYFPYLSMGVRFDDLAARSQVDEEEALATRELLEHMGAEYEQELEELKASVIE